jgi:uncharacterized damage-inducible protein DinB
MRLRGTPARLEEITRGVSSPVMIARPGDAWSAQEHAGHLMDLESLWMARANDFLGGSDTLTPADLTNRRTHEANHNGRALSDIMERFRAERLQLVDHVEKVERQLVARSLLHPRLKQPMRLVDHLYFVAEHDDHHLAKIWELIKR